MSKRSNSAAFAIAAWASIAGWVGAAGAVTPLSPEFQVNTLTAGHQYRSRMSMTSSGDYVVTWTSAAKDGDGFGIVARRFGSTGPALGGEFVVNSHTLDDQQLSTVSVNGAGLFVVVWRGQDGDQSGVFARRFASTGSPQGADFQVNTHTSGVQDSADVAVGQAGGFFVIWQSTGQDGDSGGIFARRHNGSGIPQATEFQVNAATSGSQFSPRIAITVPSELVAVWTNGSNVVGRRLGSSGAVGAEFQINELTNTGSSSPALAPTGDGGFIVAWESARDGGFRGIFARRFDSAGAPVTPEFQVNAYTVAGQYAPEVAGNGTDFVVAWHSLDQDGSNSGVFARQLDSAGPVGDEFQVNLYTTGIQREASVGTRSDGAFVVVWDSAQDGYGNGVFARRFTMQDLATLDVDGNGSTEALTDGLLVLRHLFGFTGTTLTASAVDLANCSRCDALAIVDYLGGLGLILDIDGDGELVALTDGLLVLRFLFGFTGTTLTGGAVDADCVRCDAAAIVPYLQSLQ